MQAELDKITDPTENLTQDLCATELIIVLKILLLASPYRCTHSTTTLKLFIKIIELLGLIVFIHS